MGISFYAEGCCTEVRWAYSGFHSFRKRLASSIGIDLESMQGFRKKHPQDESYIKLGTRSWDTIKSPLKHLLNHSDCDGSLSYEKCGEILSDLKVILRLWEDLNQPFPDYDKQEGLKLVILMEYCASNKKDLHFL